MISLTQIKAARALLSWTQETLARAAGLSLPAINNLERGLTSPRRDTLAAIETAFEEAGIEFLDMSGVRLKTPELVIDTIEGPQWLEQYDQDIFSVLKTPQDEILQMASQERAWIIYSGVTNHLYVEHRQKTGFKERLLVPTTIDFITSNPAVYRTLDAKYFGDTTYQIYGNRVAHILWPARKIVLIKSQVMADAMRAQFELMWEAGKLFTPAQLKKIERWSDKSL